MLSNTNNHYILTCGSICDAVLQVHKLFAKQCRMQIELSSAVQCVNKNFVDRTISNPRLLSNVTIDSNFCLEVFRSEVML